MTVVAWACVVAFVVVALGSSLIGRTVFLGTDVLGGVSPWAYYGLGAVPVVNVLVGDTIDSVVPSTLLLKHSLLDGTFAQWNPYVLGGSPLGAVPNTGLFSPVGLVWFLVPDSYAPGAVKLLEIVVAAAGMVLLGRRWRLSSAAQAVATLAFISSGFMIAWTNWPQTRVAAFIPLLFWACDRAIDRRRVRDAVPVALVLAAMLLGGFPAVVGYAAYAVLAYSVVRLVAWRVDWRGWLRALAVGVGGALLGVLLAAWQVIPFAIDALYSVNFESRIETPQRHLRWQELSTLIIPGMNGIPGDSTTWTPESLNPVEAFSYVGVGVAVLALLALLTRRRRAGEVLWFAVGATAVCLVLIYVGGTPLALAQQLPIFSNNFVGRMRVLVGFFVAVIAAFGFDKLVRGPDARTDLADGRGRVHAGVVLVVAATVVAVGAVTIRGNMLEVDAEVIGGVRHQTLVVLVTGAAALLLGLLAWWRGRAWRVVAGVVLPVVVVAQAGAVVTDWWPRSDPASFYPVTATHEFLADNLGEQRYVSAGRAMLPSTNTGYELRSTAGHTFHGSEWRDMMEGVDPDAMQSATFSVLPVDEIASPVLDRLATRYAVVEPQNTIQGTQEVLGAPATSATATADEPVTSVPLAGPVRGVAVTLPEGIGEPRTTGDTVGVTVTVRATDDGEELASTDLRLSRSNPPFSTWVALAGDHVAADRGWVLEVRPHGTDTLEVATLAGGELAGVVAYAADDGLRIVHTGDTTIYERAGALDRFRWASTVTVVDDDDQVAALASGTLADDTVVMHEAGEPTEAGSSGRIAVDADDPGHVALDVDADGAGYLVVADTLLGGGWTATVDGQPVDIVEADHALAAVHVTEGTHRVELRYEAPGWRAGWVATAAGWLLAAVIVAGAVLRDRRRRLAAATVPADGDGAPHADDAPASPQAPPDPDPADPSR